MEESNEFLNVIDTATNTVVIHALQANTFHDQLAITPDGTRVYITSPIFTEVSVLDTGTRAIAPGTESGLFDLDRTTEAFLWWREYRNKSLNL